MIAMAYDEPTTPRLYSADDLPWIAQLLAIAEHTSDVSWRELTAQIQRAELDAEPVHRTIMLQALRQVERARERPAVASWPAAPQLAAVANLARLQSWVRRAHSVQLRVWEGAYALARRAAQLGVIADLRRDRDTAGDAFLLDAVGPLELPQASMAYGRALATLVPILAGHARFTLDLHASLHGADVRLRIAPPILLSPSLEPGPDPDQSGAADQLAADLHALGHTVERAPPPIELGEHLLFPELALHRHGATHPIELLPFSTRAHLITKLTRYRSAGHNAILCVDRTYARDCDVDLPVCGFCHHVDVDDLLSHAR